MIFNLLLLENLGLSSLTMVKSCKISPFTSYKFFCGRYLRFTMVLGHLFFGCILGGRLWNAGPIFLGLSMFFFCSTYGWTEYSQVLGSKVRDPWIPNQSVRCFFWCFLQDPTFQESNVVGREVPELAMEVSSWEIHRTMASLG